MNELKIIEDLEEVFEKSKLKSQLILKHSTQCPISAAAYDEVREFLKLHPKIAAHLLLVIESRPVSNMLEERTGVQHESPQVLAIRNGKSVWSASHSDITVAALEEEFSS